MKTNQRTTAKIDHEKSRRMGKYKDTSVPNSKTKVMSPERKPGDMFTDARGRKYMVAVNGNFVKVGG